MQMPAAGVMPEQDMTHYLQGSSYAAPAFAETAVSSAEMVFTEGKVVCVKLVVHVHSRQTLLQPVPNLATSCTAEPPIAIVQTYH